MLQRMLDVIFPRTCPVCGKALVASEQLVCDLCKRKATLITEPTCRRCGKSIAKTSDEYCFDCKKRGEVHYDKGFAVWEYDKYMKESVARFKYSGRREYGDYFVSEVLYHYGSQLKQLELDAILPIPLHKEKQRFRGFNQAEVLAQGIADGLGVLMRSDLIVRKKNTKPQKGLDDRERYDNLRHAFEVNEDSDAKKLRRVLLVDDIYTTGATIDQCAARLKEAGVDKIYFVCLCIGRDF